MAAPGVNVSTATRSGPTGVVLAPSGQYFAVGLSERGPVNSPVKINSMGDYKRVFGERVPYGALFDDLSAFFECGGTQAHVLRVVGPAATVGTYSLMDGAATPAATIKINAASPGAWSSRITVQVEVGTNGADSRKVTVRLDGVVVEAYNNLTTVADIITRFGASPYVRLEDLGSLSAAPTNMPAAGAPVALTAGVDDRAAVNAAVLTAALPLLKVGLGDGSVAAPGFGQAMHTALIDHAKEHRRVALLTVARGATVSDLAAAGLALGGVAGVGERRPVRAVGAGLRRCRWCPHHQPRGVRRRVPQQGARDVRAVGGRCR